MHKRWTPMHRVTWRAITWVWPALASLLVQGRVRNFTLAWLPRSFTWAWLSPSPSLPLLSLPCAPQDGRRRGPRRPGRGDWVEAGARGRVPVSALLPFLLRHGRHGHTADPHGVPHDGALHRGHALHRPRLGLDGGAARLRHVVLRGRLRVGVALCQAEQGFGVDQDNGTHRRRLLRPVRAGGAAAQHGGRGLQLARRHPVWHHGGGCAHLGLRFVPPRPRRHPRRPQLLEALRSALPGLPDSAADSREEVVLAELGTYPTGRASALREHLHRDVLHLHLLLELQVLLCVRFRTARLLDPAYGHCLREHRHHLLHPEC
mmetsp:Transcript_14346/g.39206  ORF Transcript_14346/g.39206 Transcript_14346/m.39206 type:complete len:318 (+) Transcript_14346:124-1077(+)